MKKFYAFISAVVLVSGISAQNRAFQSLNNNHTSNNHLSVHAISGTDRAMGDTLMWLPAPGVFLYDPADQAAFDLVTEDIDGHTPYNAPNAPMDFSMYYSVNTDVDGLGNPTGDNYYHPWEDQTVDSAWFWGATSWFNPAAAADNWIMFGPVTIPSTGAKLKWYDRTNPAYRDGYKVFVSTTASSPITFADFNDPAIYTKTDAYPSPTYATDTTWVLRTVSIPATYNGNPIYIAFNHTANDMDFLYLDEFTVTDALSTGFNEFVNGVKVAQNMPNPFSTLATVSYELEKSAPVSLSVYDVTGKMVAAQSEGTQSAGTHTLTMNASDLAAGVYYYTLTVGENTTSTMKMVVVK